MNTFTFVRRAILALLLGRLAATFACAQTTVSISFAAGRLADSSGTPLADGRLVVLVADTANDGFGAIVPGSALSVGSLLGADDLILFTAFVDSGSYDLGGVAHSLTAIDLASAPYIGVSPGDPLALVWFSALDGSALSVPASAEYGLFSGGSTPHTGSPWVVPSAGGANDLEFLTTDVDAENGYASALGQATLTAVPEPSTCAALAGLVALGAALVRRRGRAA